MDTHEKTRRAPSGKRRSGAAAAKRRPGQKAPQRSGRGAVPERKQRPRQDLEKRLEQQERTVRSDAPEVVFKPNAQTRRPGEDSGEARRMQQRRRSAQRMRQRQKTQKTSANRPAVVYTQPKPVNWNKLLLQMLIALAVVLAVVMGLSVFFKVDQVVVYGNEAYSAWTVQEAAGIEGGENLMTFNSTKASAKIKAALPYVKSARIGIKLPDTVNIYIEEVDVAYAIKSQNGTWWLMTSSGNVVEQIDGGTASSYTKVLGVELDEPEEGGIAKAVETVTSVSSAATAEDGTDPAEDDSLVSVITGSQRLQAALEVLSALEKNDVVGEAASVDVSSLTNIELWYGQRFQVNLGDSSDMVKKVSWMKSTISQLKEYDMGILDVSFVTWPDMVGYTPFEN